MTNSGLNAAQPKSTYKTIFSWRVFEQDGCWHTCLSISNVPDSNVLKYMLMVKEKKMISADCQLVNWDWYVKAYYIHTKLYHYMNKSSGNVLYWFEQFTENTKYLDALNCVYDEKTSTTMPISSICIQFVAFDDLLFFFFQILLNDNRKPCHIRQTLYAYLHSWTQNRFCLSMSFKWPDVLMGMISIFAVHGYETN